MQLDKLTKKFGFPVGLATLSDEVGIDVGSHIGVDLLKAYGDRFKGGDNINIFADMVKAGFLGKIFVITREQVSKFLENLSEDTRSVMSHYFLTSSISQLITVKF